MEIPTIAPNKSQFHLNPQNREECEGYTGPYAGQWLEESETLIYFHCNYPTQDGGKACRNMLDCESRNCLAPEGVVIKQHGVIGFCAEWHDVLDGTLVVNDRIVYKLDTFD